MINTDTVTADIQNNELCFFDQAPEIHAFFNASDNLEALFQKLKPLYLRQGKQLNLMGEMIFVTEQITPLEIAALTNQLEHLSIILASTPNGRTPRRTISLMKMQPVEAFFRALNQGHVDIANLLLDLPEVVDGASHVTIQSGSPTRNPLNGYKSYLERIQRPDRYRTLNLQLRNTGNVALIMAASLNDPTIFMRLLTIDVFRKQLPQSGVQAFLCATTTPNGINRASLQQEIIDCLLERPEVFSFAYSRAFDFSYLVEAFMQKRLKQLHDDPELANNMKKSEVKNCVYFLLYLIEFNPAAALTKIEFLLNIPSVQLATKKPLELTNEFPFVSHDNALLHWAIKHQNQAVIDLLLKNISDIPDIQLKHHVYGYGTSHAHSSHFFKSLAINITSRCSDTDLSTLGNSKWPSENDLVRGVSALTIDMNAPSTPAPTIEDTEVGELSPF